MASKVVTHTTGARPDVEAEDPKQLLDGAARYFLGMSGAEFAAKWDARDLDRDSPEVIQVAVLLRSAR